MGKHQPSTVWALRPIGEYPQIYVRTASDTEIDIEVFAEASLEGYVLQLTRPDARLLAKRINQCLDATK